jgi:hypothetical protein
MDADPVSRQVSSRRRRVEAGLLAFRIQVRADVSLDVPSLRSEPALNEVKG